MVGLNELHFSSSFVTIADYPDKWDPNDRGFTVFSYLYVLVVTMRWFFYQHSSQLTRFVIDYGSISAHMRARSL